MIIRRFFLLYLLLPLSILYGSSQAQERCVLPSGYLEEVHQDFNKYGTAIAEVDINDMNALAEFFVELGQVRHHYEAMIENLPECALRLHIYLLTLLATMQDSISLAMVIQAVPDQAETYLPLIEDANARTAEFVTLVEREIKRLERLPPLMVLYIKAEAVNVRSGPGPSFEAIGTLEAGDRIEVIAIDLDEDQNTWYKFYFEDDTGWVLGELTSSTPP